MKRFLLPLVLVILASAQVQAQPSVVPDGIRFVYDNPTASSVSLVGDFNSWSALSTPMKKTESGSWNVTVPILPGSYQYAFLVDGSRMLADPANPLSYEVVDGSRVNSLITIAGSKLVTEGYPTRLPLNDSYEKKGGTVYLNLVLKHHLPLYYDAKKDCIEAPWVRMHATRDYFEMADVIQRYPNVHATAVLSPTLLWQIQEIYVKRLEPFVKKNKTWRYKVASMDVNGFLARMKGKTDPWIDACLTPAERLSDEDKAWLYKKEWNAFTMSPARMNRFPELMRLHEKWKDAKGNPTFSVQELRTLKFFSIFGHFDTEFFERKVPLIQTGTRINLALDLRDIISYRSDGKYYLKREITEEDCGRIVASAYHIMYSILPNFEKVKYNVRARIGQLELAASSFADAVLPLVINSDIARQTDADAVLPATFAHPEDADAQLKMAIAAYQKYFNVTPTGYVPPYGAMSAAVVPVLAKNGFEWFTAHDAVLQRSTPGDLSAAKAYQISADGAKMAGVFSNALLVNRVNWVYRNYYAENAAHDFVEQLLTFAPENEKEDALVTVVIDNDDAWMHYVRDTDGKGFINGLYRKLNALYANRAIVSTTVTEYIMGNRERGIAAHPLANMPIISQLGSGSRIDGNFTTWIGNKGSNDAWNIVRAMRERMKGVAPVTGPELYDNLGGNAYALYSGATSPHWFEAFGATSVLERDGKSYESIFLGMLNQSAALAGVSNDVVKPFVPAGLAISEWTRPKKLTRVTFLCKLIDREAITSVFVAGNRKELANMEPNTVRMWDNGENGDEVFGNNVWTLVVDLEEGDLLYKYSNSGGQGTWDGSEDFPDVWRKATITGDKMTISDIFGQLKKK